MRLWNSCHGGDTVNMCCMFSSQESIGSAAGSHVLRSARPLCGHHVWLLGSSAVPANIPAVLFGAPVCHPESFNPPLPLLFG